MDLRHLRYFIAVVEEGSFSEAARNRLRVSQPSLSRQIRELEAKLGVVLLSRGTQGVQLTAAGQVFLEHARRILEDVQHMIDTTRQAEHVVHVGCLPGLEHKVLSDLRRIGASCSPSTIFKVVGDVSPDLHAKVVKGVLDMAFAWPDQDVPDLQSVIVCQQEIIAILPASYPDSEPGFLSLQELRNQICIAPDPAIAPAFWSTIESWFRRYGLKNLTTHFAINLTSATALLSSVGGFILVPEFIRPFVAAEFKIMKLFDSPSITVNLVYRTASRPLVGQLASAIVDRWNQTEL